MKDKNSTLRHFPNWLREKEKSLKRIKTQIIYKGTNNDSRLIIGNSARKKR